MGKTLRSIVTGLALATSLGLGGCANDSKNIRLEDEVYSATRISTNQPTIDADSNYRVYGGKLHNGLKYELGLPPKDSKDNGAVIIMYDSKDEIDYKMVFFKDEKGYKKVILQNGDLEQNRTLDAKDIPKEDFEKLKSLGK